MKIGFVVVILALVCIGLFAPVLKNGSSVLRVCKFDEAAGSYTRCFWRWDDALNEPSIYF